MHGFESPFDQFESGDDKPAQEYIPDSLAQVHTVPQGYTGEDQPLPNLDSDAREKRVWTRASAIMLAVSITLVGSAVGAEYAYNQSKHTVEAPCTDRGQSYARLGANILQSPKDPHIARILDAPINLPHGVNGRSVEGQRIYTIGNEQEVQQTRQYEARKLGLTILDPRPYETGLVGTPVVDNMSDYGKMATNKPFSAFFDASRKFLARYGVTLSIGAKDMTYAYSGRAPTRRDLETATAKEDIFNLLTAFAAEPVQYPQKMGLKHLILMAGKHSYAAAYAGGDTIVENVSASNDAPVTWHEEGHLDDQVTCGSETTTDPALTSLNGAERYHGKKNPVPATVYARYDNSNSVNNLWETLLNAFNKHKTAQMCATSHDLTVLGKNVVFISDYAGTNAAEDKAELYASLPDPTSESLTLDPHTEKLDRKFELVFGRLYKSMPRIARYFAGVASAPDANLFCPTGTMPPHK